MLELYRNVTVYSARYHILSERDNAIVVIGRTITAMYDMSSPPPPLSLGAGGRNFLDGTTIYSIHCVRYRLY